MSFTLDDFLKDCQKCCGSGQKPNPNASGGGGSIGLRRGPQTFGDNKCGACRGTGKELTEAGKAIESVIDYVIEKRKSMYGSL